MARRSVAPDAIRRSGGVPASPLKHPRVVRLTEAFMRVRESYAEGQVEGAVKLGGILAAGRGILKGLYCTWVTEQLHISRWSAVRFVALAQMATQAPQVLRRLKHAGVSRLVPLAFLPEESRAALVRRHDVTRLPYRAFLELVRRYRVGDRRATDNMRAHSLTLRLRAVRGTLERTRLRHVTSVAARTRLEAEVTQLMRAGRVVLADLRTGGRRLRTA